MASRIAFLTFLFLIIGSLFCTVVRAEEDDLELADEEEEPKGSAPPVSDEEEFEEVEEEGEEFLAPHPDVDTLVYFKDALDKRFVIGEPVVVLIGLHNRGDQRLDLTEIGAHFHSPYDLSYYIQNFTRRSLNTFLPPNFEVTLEYKFVPDKSLEPLNFWLSGWVEYNSSSGRYYRSTFTNGTVELIEKQSDADFRRIFAVLFVIGLGGLIAYFFINSNAQRSSKKKVQEQGTRTAQTTDADWGEIHKQKAKPSKRWGKKSGPKSS